MVSRAPDQALAGQRFAAPAAGAHWRAVAWVLVLAMALVASAWFIASAADQIAAHPPIEARTVSGWRADGRWWKEVSVDGVRRPAGSPWTEQPGVDYPYRGRLRMLLTNEDLLHRAAANGQTVALHADGHTLSLAFAPVGLRGLPVDFWVPLALSLAVLAGCAAVCLWRPRGGMTDRVLAFCALACGVGFFGMVNTINLFAVRPWALPYAGSMPYVYLFVGCLNLYLTAVGILVGTRPRPLLGPRALAAWATLAASAMLLLMLGRGTAALWLSRGAAGISMVVMVALVLLQQRASRDSVLDRMVMRWVLVGVAAGWVLPVGLQVAWLATAQNAGAPPVFGYLCLSMFTLSLLALLQREVLFRIEHLWPSAWGVVVAVTAFAGTNALLRLGSGWPHIAVLALAACASVLLFLGTRQLLARRQPRADRTLPRYLARMAAPSQGPLDMPELERRWRAVLQMAFTPVAIEGLPQVGMPSAASIGEQVQRASAIAHGGEQLRVHSFIDGECVLTGAAQGQRSFTARDVRLADELCQIAFSLWQPQTHFLRGVQAERERLAADLHDDIGGRLLYLSQAGEGGATQAYARHVLDDLRQLTRGLARGNRTWGELLADLRFDLNSRVTAHGAVLHWQAALDADIAAASAPVEAATDLAALLSELCRNALQHAAPRALWVAVEGGAGGALHLVFAHDAAEPIAPPQAWTPGFGLQSIRRRVGKLHGSMAWAARDAADGGGARFEATLQLLHRLKVDA